MSKKPFIGLNTDFFSATHNRPAYSLLCAGYYDAILATGGIPIVVPPVESLDDLNTILDRLDGFVLIGGRDLDHRDFRPGLLVPDRVHHVSGLERQQPAHLDVDPRIRDAFVPDTLLGYLLAECNPRTESLAHRLQGALGCADHAHAMMDTARPEAALGDFEAAAWAGDDAAHRQAHVVEQEEFGFGAEIGRVTDA